MRGMIATAFIILFLAVPARGQDACGYLLNSSDTLSTDPAILASAWLMPLERLYTAIPSLSPQEEEWLQKELQGETPERFARALSSREYSIRQAKLNAGSLLSSVRKIQSNDEQVRYWLLFAYTLIEDDAARNLERLVTEGVIKREAIPSDWALFSKRSLRESIVHQRVFLARHVLGCTLPSIIEPSTP